MTRLFEVFVYVILSTVTVAILLPVGMIKGSWTEANKWGSKHIPWWWTGYNLHRYLIGHRYPRVDRLDGKGWVDDICCECGKGGTSVTYRDLDGEETHWCTACFREHHVPDFQPASNREEVLGYKWL